LIIACPCVLGLANSMMEWVKSAIQFIKKNAEALENMNKVNVSDYQTGTITEGTICRKKHFRLKIKRKICCK
jgi:cation transport ATPase